jgi:hypothetical protein
VLDQCLCSGSQHWLVWEAIQSSHSVCHPYCAYSPHLLIAMAAGLELTTHAGVPVVHTTQGMSANLEGDCHVSPQLGLVICPIRLDSPHRIGQRLLCKSASEPVMVPTPGSCAAWHLQPPGSCWEWVLL